MRQSYEALPGTVFWSSIRVLIAASISERMLDIEPERSRRSQSGRRG
jgi:hypothetical protein